MGKNRTINTSIWRDVLSALLSRSSDPGDLHLRAQVLQRKKDDHSKNKVLKRYTFKSLADYTDHEEEIIKLCNDNNARFYVNVNLKSFKVIGYEVLEESIKAVKTGDYERIKKVYDSVADKNMGVKDYRVWIIDIDEFCPRMVSKHQDILDGLISRAGINLIGFNYTRSGVHMLVSPFDVNRSGIMEYMRENDLNFELKRNAMTPLYWKESRREE